MNSTCPGCGVVLPAEAVSETLRVARCPGCARVLDLDVVKLPGLALGEATPKALGTRVALPAGWHVDEGPYSLRVSWSWRTAKLFFIVPFTLFWNGIMLMMFVGTTAGSGHPAMGCLGIFVPHVWVGVGLAYYIVAAFLNTTEVSYADRALRVHHGPMPWRGNLSVSLDELEQLFVVESRTRNGVTYQLCALLRDGRRQALLKHLSDLTKARYLERRLEEVMGLANLVVEGEVRS